MNLQQNNANKTMADETQQTPSGKTACGGKLKDPKNFPSAIYRGEQIYFCTIACLRVFEQNPDPFMAGEIEHPTDDD
jgi:YHS domain-containing protein